MVSAGEQKRGRIHYQITEKNLDVYASMKFLERKSCGAMLWFIGRVRDHNEGQFVTGITYETSVPHAMKSFYEICNEVHQNFGCDLEISIVHRVGELKVGDWSILVGVASPHRVNAYEASRFVIEEIKKRTPIWKKEHYESKESRWLKGTPLHAT